jgi:hypothetical protein
MAKKKVTPQVAELQPDELGELKKVVKEFVSRLQNIDNELSELRLSRKELLEEFADKLDVKTLQTAMKVLEIEAGVQFKHNYDMFQDVLKDDFVNNLVDE